jgi:hypothetical protein
MRDKAIGPKKAIRFLTLLLIPMFALFLGTAVPAVLAIAENGNQTIAETFFCTDLAVYVLPEDSMDRDTRSFFAFHILATGLAKGILPNGMQS